MVGAAVLLLGCASTKRNVDEATGGQTEVGGNAVEDGQAGAVGTGGKGPVLGDSPAEACMAFELAACERREACGSPPTYNCLLETRGCPDLAFFPGSTLTAVGLKTCANAWADLSCARVLAGELPACVTPGTLPEGDACLYASQCESLYCEPGDVACGACASGPPPELARPGQGEACKIELSCSRGLYCGGPENDLTCLPFSKRGEVCDDYRFCDPSLYCSLEGVCLLGPGDAEECALSNTKPQQYYVCGKSFECDESVSPPRCRKSGQLGTRCRFSEQCAEGLLCDCPAGANCVSTTCLTARFVGESCADLDSVCHPSFVCRDGTCAPSGVQGDFSSMCLP